MTSPEVLAVQQLAAEPTDESVTRAWYQITRLEKARVTPRRRWIPVTAAAAVVLLAVGSVALLRIGPGTLWPTASSQDALATLRALADRAEAVATQPPQLRPGQLIHVKFDGWAATFSDTNADINTGVLEPQPRLNWYAPEGMMAVRISNGTDDFLAGPKADAPLPELADLGVNHPSPQWLAQLPTDPAKLLSLLRRDVGHNDRWTVDHQLWDAMAQLYSTSEIVLTPQVRAALLRSFTGLSGLSQRHVTVDGVDLVAIRQTDGDSGVEILFDPGTGRAVGRASVITDQDVTIVQPPGSPALDPGIDYQTTWVQSIVDSAA